jgi:hypothetical protein
MAAIVRMYAHSGLMHAFVSSYADQQSFHSMTMLAQPYLYKESITANTGAAQSTAAALGISGSRLLHIQIEPGKRVHIEVNPPGRSGGLLDATTGSPVFEGNDTIQWGKDWTVSLLEAS